MKSIAVFTLLLVFCQVSFAQEATIVLPPFHDRYSETVKKLESGDTTINFREFRESFIESRQFIVSQNQVATFDSLTKAMYAAIHKEAYKDLVHITKAMLSLDYTSMLAHKILYQTLNILGDSIQAKKYHAIEMGLLRSIVNNGDGKTCATAWPVIQTSEEYFILNMLGAELKQQSFDQTDGVCDRMDVQTDDGDQTYYFEVSEVFKGYEKLGIK